MATASLGAVLRELYSAPLEAAVQAEADYRRIWADWLAQKLELVTKEDGSLRDGVVLADVLQTAPVVNVDGKVEVAITMRIASVTEKKAGLGIGLALGPIHASGSFGFMNRTTQESVLQASTVVTLSNNDQVLTDYLAQHHIPVTAASEVTEAIKFLQSAAGTTS